MCRKWENRSRATCEIAEMFQWKQIAYVLNHRPTTTSVT